MPFILAALNWIMPTISTFAVTFFTRKVTVIAITIPAFISFTVLFLVCIETAISSVLALAIMPTWLTQGVGMFLPDDFAVVLSGLISSNACRWAYDKAIDKIRMINGAN